MTKYCGKWPNSVIFNLLRGKREMINRNAKIANAIYAGALLVDSDWEFFKNTLYLGMNDCYHIISFQLLIAMLDKSREVSLIPPPRTNVVQHGDGRMGRG